MKRTLSYLVLLTGLTGAYAQEAGSSVQVTPSDQVIYPDASQILNKTDPKKTAAPLPPAPLGSTKPVVAATPALARPLAKAPSLQGWFLRWTVNGDEAGVRAWAAKLADAQISSLGTGLWEVLSGPLTPEQLSQALTSQAGQAQLVKR